MIQAGSGGWLGPGLPSGRVLAALAVLIVLFVVAGLDVRRIASASSAGSGPVRSRYRLDGRGTWPAGARLAPGGVRGAVSAGAWPESLRSTG